MASEEDDQMVSRTVSGTSFITNREDSAEAVESGYEDFEEIQVSDKKGSAAKATPPSVYIHNYMYKSRMHNSLARERPSGLHGKDLFNTQYVCLVCG